MGTKGAQSFFFFLLLLPPSSSFPTFFSPTVPTVAHTHIPKCHPHPFYFFAIVAPRPRTSLHVFNAQTPSSLFFFCELCLRHNPFSLSSIATRAPPPPTKQLKV